MSDDDLTWVIPLALHEDAGPVTKQLSATCLSFSAVLGEGTEKISHFLCASYLKRVGNNSELQGKALWGAILSDFEALSRGRIGGLDVAAASGSAGGRWRFLPLFAKGDEQTRCDQWGLVHYSGRHFVCPECLADRSGKAFTDLRPTAAWRGTEVDFQQYTSRMRSPHHPLIKSRFYWRFF